MKMLPRALGRVRLHALVEVRLAMFRVNMARLV